MNYDEIESMSTQQLKYEVATLLARNDQLGQELERTTALVDGVTQRLTDALAHITLEQPSIEGQALPPDEADELASYRALGNLQSLREKLSDLMLYQQLASYDTLAGMADRLAAYESVGTAAECAAWKDAAAESESPELIASRAAAAALKARYSTDNGGVPRGLISFTGTAPSSSCLPWTAINWSVDVAEAKTKRSCAPDLTSWFEPSGCLKIAFKLPAGNFGALVAIKGSVKIRTASSATVSTVGLGTFIRGRGGHVCKWRNVSTGTVGKVYDSTVYSPLVPTSWGGVSYGESAVTSWVVDSNTILLSLATREAANVSKPLVAGVSIMSTSYAITSARILGVAAVLGGDSARTQTGALRFSDSGQVTSLGVLGSTSENWRITAAMLTQPSILTGTTDANDLQTLIDSL